MWRFVSLARVAALETLSEPLSAVLFLSAFVAVHVLPAFHYRQFGEAGRLSRECGFSTLLVFGVVFAASAALNAISREFDRGTAAAALAAGVPRAVFFVAKVSGSLAALALFAMGVACATALAIASSEIGAKLAAEGLASARVWGGGVALGVLPAIAAFFFAAVANRFAKVRFCYCACVCLVVSQLFGFAAAIAVVGDGAPRSPVAVLSSIAPAMAALFAGACAFVALAGALATRFKPAPAGALLATAVVLSFLRPIRAVLPDSHFFWRVDALSNGGVFRWGAAMPMLAAGATLVAFWLVAGAWSMHRRELA